MNVLEVLRRSTRWLGERGVENPRLDAEILLAHGLGCKRMELYVAFDRPLEAEELDRIRELIRRRANREPVAYLTGEREFWSLTFAVGPGVLVPRPETEHLVEAGLAALRDLTSPVFADVGTGSGCVAVAVLSELAAARAHATDVSPAALETAARNAARHGVGDRLTLHEGDLLEPLRGHPDFGRLDAVLSNPPYIVEGDPSVEPGVREHEPAEALFVGGDDPLAVARRVAEAACDALRPGGVFALEVGAGSAVAAAALLDALGYVEIDVKKDLAGIERIVSGRRPA